MDDMLLRTDGLVGLARPGCCNGNVGLLSNGDVFGLCTHNGVGDVLGENSFPGYKLGDLQNKNTFKTYPELRTQPRH